MCGSPLKSVCEIGGKKKHTQQKETKKQTKNQEDGTEVM